MCYQTKAIAAHDWDRLNRCPHCAQHMPRWNYPTKDTKQIECINCGMRGPSKTSRQAALDAWNGI